jgi:hypothetical protein
MTRWGRAGADVLSEAVLDVRHNCWDTSRLTVRHNDENETASDLDL